MKRGEIGRSSKRGSRFLNTQPDVSTFDFSSTALPTQPDHGLQPSPLSTMRRSNLDTVNSGVVSFFEGVLSTVFDHLSR